MSWIEKRIQHHKWGGGTVKAQRHGDYELLIRFDNGVITWLKKNECNLYPSEIPAEITLKTQPLIKPPVAEPGHEIMVKRRAIEAFKLGIVPPFVKDFVFGRDKEIEYVNKWLDQDELNYMLLFGDYGTGKTHMLKYIREMALEKNYAVAYCNLDPEEAPFYKPKMVYKSIVTHFTYPQEKGFRDFITQISTENQGITTDNPFVNIVMNYPKNDELFWRWIEADDLIKTLYGFPTLYPWGTAANIFCNLLSIFGHYAIASLDLNGVLLLFDEAESLHFPSYYGYQYEKGRNFFKGLLCTASNDHRLLSERVSISTPRTGMETGLIYCGNNQINYFYRNPTGLKVLFALTRSPDLEQFCLDIGYSKYTPLQSLKEKDRIEIIEAIQRLYESAYPSITFDSGEFDIIQDIVLELGKENIRSLIKTTIEALDLKRHWPDVEVEELLI